MRQMIELNPEWRIVVNDFGAFVQRRHKHKQPKRTKGGNYKVWHTDRMFKTIDEALDIWHKGYVPYGRKKPIN